jgi:hypothetical protein
MGGQMPEDRGQKTKGRRAILDTGFSILVNG